MKKQVVRSFVSSLLNSYTLVFFSRNKLFGLILLMVSFFDIYTGIAGLVSVIVTNAFALMLGLNYKKIGSGLYGFNALLVGLGMGIAIQPSFAFYIILVFITLATLLLTLAFEGIIGKYALPYLSIPFLISIWVAIMATRSYTGLDPGESGIFTMNTMFIRGGPVFVDLYNWFNDLTWSIYIKTYFRSLGAIIFQYHLLAGLLIAVGLLLYSRIAFLYSVIGFTSAWFFYVVIGADIHELDYSFIGFNHILTAIAIGSFFTIASKWSMLWVLLITPLVSMLITTSGQILGIYQLPVFSLPFNVVVLMFLYALKFRERMTTKPEVVTIQHFSPERNLYATINSNERFRGVWFFPLSLPFYGFRNITQAHNGSITHKDEWQHAWDFVIIDEKGKEYEKDGVSLTDYYCYNKPVLAPADGWIQDLVNHVEDNEPGITNIEQNWGNSIVIKHTEYLYTKVSHLKKESILFPKGAFVQKGQVIAYSGNSGRSPYPHLHFQVQANPYIGSSTIQYPISQYISLNDSFKLNLYNVPSKDDQVENIQSESSLVKAFRFTPGQIIEFDVNGKENGHWEVMTDSYKNIYIYCAATKSTAWLKTDGNLFYFTHFQGDRKSILYYFFLAAYQVPLGYYKNMEVNDVLPPTVLPYSFLRLVQDFVAPFILFIKPLYTMKFMEKEEDMAGNTVRIRSQVRFRFLGYTFIHLLSQITIKETGLHKLIVSNQGKEDIINFRKQENP